MSVFVLILNLDHYGTNSDVICAVYYGETTGEEIRESDIICYDLKQNDKWHLWKDSTQRCLISIDQCIQDLDSDEDVTKFQRI